MLNFYPGFYRKNSRRPADRASVENFRPRPGANDAPAVRARSLSLCLSRSLPFSSLSRISMGAECFCILSAPRFVRYFAASRRKSAWLQDSPATFLPGCPPPCEAHAALRSPPSGLGAKMVDFGGWAMPVQLPGGILDEHRATRTAVGRLRRLPHGRDPLPRPARRRGRAAPGHQRRRRAHRRARALHRGLPARRRHRRRPDRLPRSTATTS